MATTFRTMFDLCRMERNNDFLSIYKALIHARRMCENGHLYEALQVVENICQRQMHVSTKILHCLLRGCIDKKDLAAGRKLHCLILRYGFEANDFLTSHLIRMFAVCGSLHEADQVFGKLVTPNVLTWTAIILAHAKLGQGEQAIKMYHLMQNSNVKPDEYILVAVFKVCSHVAALDQGRLIHAQVIEGGYQCHVLVGNTLIDMYAKCGSLEDARGVFNKFPKRDVVTWSTMIAGYAEHGCGKDAIEFFQQMRQEGLLPNFVTFLGALKACSRMAVLDQGKHIHVHIIESGFGSDEYVGSSLITMYASCRSSEKAHKVFDNLSRDSVVTWNSMIAAYVEDDNHKEAFRIFEQLKCKGIDPNDVTFVCILKACANVSALDQGKLIHSEIIENALEANVYIESSLIDMYINCGSLEDAHLVFNKPEKGSIVAWSAMIAGYTKHGFCQEALYLFQQMQQKGTEADNVAFVSSLKACSSIAALDQGKQIHGHIIRGGQELNLFIGNTLIDMYVKCGSVEDACRVFNKLPKRDLVTWNAMIAGHTEEGRGEEALQHFQKMQMDGIKPNNTTFVNVIRAYSSISALDLGRQLHACVTESDIETNVFLGSTLIHMYAKSGSLEDACSIFNQVSLSDTVTWSAIIGGYARHSNFRLALQNIQDMQRGTSKPNDVTFICLFSACSHLGLVEEGCYHFKMMCEEHKIMPTLDHYHCMVDLLGRAGCLEDAEDLLQTMPFHSNLIGWMSLLSHCRTHSYVELGKQAFDNIVMVDPRHSSGYVLMSNIYTDAGMWKDADKVHELRQHVHAWKKPGKAVIEAEYMVHGFTVASKSHQQSDGIYAKLDFLSEQMKNEGHVPNLNLSLKSLLDSDKEKCFLWTI